MSWFPVDDAFHSHPKSRKAGLEAVGLWTVSGAFCMAYLTDGFVPEWFVRQQPRGMALAKKLVEAGLWRTAKRDGELGFQFHDWKHECTKTVILANREKARQRKQKSRETRDVTGDVTRDVTRDGRCESRVLLGPTQPNPTQPITSIETFSGGVTEVDADNPRPQCRKHPKENPEGIPCHACRKRREWDEANADRLKADELKAKRAERDRANACPACHGTNVIEIDDNHVRKCDHQEAAV